MNEESAMWKKRDSFRDEYDKIIQEKEEKLNDLKESYKNRPLGEKEEMIMNELMSKKAYIEELSRIEAKIIKNYINLEKNQESEFNNRFGNNLKVGHIISPNTKKLKTPTFVKKDPLPPLPDDQNSFSS